jgi:nucleoid-associated protein YgaU
MMAQQFDKYVVKAGDSLSAIAKEILGDANRWKEIWEANKEAVPDPNVIRVGQELLIPAKSTALPPLEGKPEGRVGGLRAE